MTLKERQKRIDAKPVWVAQVKRNKGTWEVWSVLGFDEDQREYAMSKAATVIERENYLWLKGNRTKYGFSRRIRFRKYYLGEQ